jgi:hypothetical protein
MKRNFKNLLIHPNKYNPHYRRKRNSEVHGKGVLLRLIQINYRQHFVMQSDKKSNRYYMIIFFNYKNR